KLVHRGRDLLAPAPLAELVEAALRESVRRDLGAEIAAALFRAAGLGDEPLERLVCQELGRDDHAFLLERAREGGEARGLDAADVGVVRARDGVAERGAGDERDVGEVRAAGV